MVNLYASPSVPANITELKAGLWKKFLNMTWNLTKRQCTIRKFAGNRPFPLPKPHQSP